MINRHILIIYISSTVSYTLHYLSLMYYHSQVHLWGGSNNHNNVSSRYIFDIEVPQMQVFNHVNILNISNSLLDLIVYYMCVPIAIQYTQHTYFMIISDNLELIRSYKSFSLHIDLLLINPILLIVYAICIISLSKVSILCNHGYIIIILYTINYGNTTTA